MNRNKWCRITIAVALAVILSFGIYTLNRPEARIRRTVVKHQEELREIAEEALRGSVKDYPGVRNEGVFESENEYKIVQFYLTGFGLVPSAVYYGFYFSPEDRPVCYQNMDFPLEQTVEGSWEWTDGTDNGGITKRITENWYYYEAWF